jgi:predicted nucleic acid-binding protein
VSIVSDTNILSSFAASEALPLLPFLFVDPIILIPPAVFQELQDGLARGKAYLEPVLQAIAAKEIRVLELTVQEQRIAQELPHKLNAGEREAIALCQQQKLLLLSNDKRAIRYCAAQNIRALDLPRLLRLLWVDQVISRHDVEVLIAKMSRSKI